MDSIKINGWQGLPLLANGDQLLTGCHRATACELLEIVPEVHPMKIGCTYGDDEYSDYLLKNLADANDQDAVLLALRELQDEGLVDDYSVEIMTAEAYKIK